MKVAGDDLLAEIAGFRLQGDLFTPGPAAAIDELSIGQQRLPRLTTELWTARQRQGHALHEVSYRACFKAELPRFFVERLTQPGDVVFDPFMGRGTTLLEAALLGRVPGGNDVNPLSRILIEPRLDPPEVLEAAARLDDLSVLLRASPRGDPEPGEPELDVFYQAETLAELRALRRWFLDREASGRLDRADRWLRMVSTNRLTGHSPGFFSGRTMPPNQAVTVETQRKLNARLGLVPPRRDVIAVLRKKSRLLLRGITDAERRRLLAVAGRARLVTGDARDLAAVPSGTVALTVTSPPFLNVVDYARDNWLRCWFNGLDAPVIGRRITTARRVDDWCAFLAPVFAELLRVTRPSGWLVFEVGEVRRGEVQLEREVLPVAAAAGWQPHGVVVHSQRFTKTANCWGVDNNAKGTNTNRLVLLSRP